MPDSGHITRRSNSNDSEDSDFDLSDMEDDFDLGGFREKRLEELKQECVCHSQRCLQSGALMLKHLALE